MMVTSNPLILNSVADGSFRCIPCGNIVYSTLHTCEEQVDEMAKLAERLMSNSTIIYPKVNENS